ncbi:MAG: alpha,alpha-trehalose-phosphate synthase (UDP-forming) [Steroidobacterales bacterium]
MSRLVAVSNRVSVPQRGAVPGGLAVGLLAAMQARGGLWFGWNGEVMEGSLESADIVRRDNVTYATIELTPREHQDYYLGFSNAILWPVFHYFLDAFRYSDEQYDAYQLTNQRFARELAALLEPDDLVWVHDYHLIPLGQKLRELGAQQPLGFFLHIPFPAFEVLRALPVYGELMQSFIAYDVVGFQTENDLANFHSAVKSIWGPDSIDAVGRIRVGDRRVIAEVFPIGVDVDGVQREATEAQASDAYKRMVAGLLGRRLMIGVDRLDYSKGLVERFRAYERFLEKHPDSQNRVTFLQIAPLSRSDVRAYSAIRQELEQAAGRTNGRFADTDWTPIRYLNRNFPHDVLMSFLRSALVGIVTPVRDGMNLVAKEFVAAQDASDPGVLILSTLAGAARELTGALQVNPYDARAMGNAIEMAFNMPLAERRDRHQQMLDALRRNDIHAWHSRFVERLAAIQRPAMQLATGTEA